MVENDSAGLLSLERSADSMPSLAGLAKGEVARLGQNPLELLSRLLMCVNTPLTMVIKTPLTATAAVMISAGRVAQYHRVSPERLVQLGAYGRAVTRVWDDVPTWLAGVATASALWVALVQGSGQRKRDVEQQRELNESRRRA